MSASSEFQRVPPKSGVFGSEDGLLFSCGAVSIPSECSESFLPESIILWGCESHLVEKVQWRPEQPEWPFPPVLQPACCGGLLSRSFRLRLHTEPAFSSCRWETAASCTQKSIWKVAGTAHLSIEMGGWGCLENHRTRLSLLTHSFVPSSARH